MTTLSPSTINWAVDHLLRYSDTTLFPRIFEYQSLGYCRDDLTVAPRSSVEVG